MTSISCSRFRFRRGIMIGPFMDTDITMALPLPLLVAGGGGFTDGGGDGDVSDDDNPRSDGPLAADVGDATATLDFRT